VLAQCRLTTDEAEVDAHLGLDPLTVGIEERHHRDRHAGDLRRDRRQVVEDCSGDVSRMSSSYSSACPAKVSAAIVPGLRA
jgi:hypothetical protein